MEPTVPTTDVQRRRADQLQPQDTVILGDLLGCTDEHTVLFAYPYQLGADEGRVLLVHRCAEDPYPQVEHLDADDSIALAPAGGS